MTVLSKLIKTPGRKADEWLLPQILKAFYVLYLALGMIAGFFWCIGLGWELSFQRCETLFFRILCTIFLTCCLYTIHLLFWIIVCRFFYEVGILLFSIFQAQRDLVSEMEILNNSVRKIAQTQLTSSQYNCDRLAEICDTLKGVDGNAADDL